MIARNHKAKQLEKQMADERQGQKHKPAGPPPGPQVQAEGGEPPEFADLLWQAVLDNMNQMPQLLQRGDRVM